MFKTQSNKHIPDNEMLCFLKFHNYEMMYDFIDYHRQNQKNFSGYKSSGYKSSTKAEKTDDDNVSKKNKIDGKPDEAKQVTIKYVCSKGHPLKALNASPYGSVDKYPYAAGCDGCSKHIQHGESFMNCSECGTDYCKTCIEKMFPAPPTVK
jgi:hypothetical protein